MTSPPTFRRPCFSARSLSSSVRTSRRKFVLLEMTITTGNSWSEVENSNVPLLISMISRKAGNAVVAVAFGIDDLAFVERDACQVNVGFDNQQAGHLAALDHLNSVENADISKISGKRYVGADLLRRFVAVGGEIGPAGPADRFEARGDRDSRIEELCFLQPVIREIEIFAGDVKADKGQALLGGLVKFFCLMQMSRIFSRSEIDRGLRSSESRSSLKAFSGELYLTNRSASSRTDSIETSETGTPGFSITWFIVRE